MFPYIWFELCVGKVESLAKDIVMEEDDELEAIVVFSGLNGEFQLLDLSILGGF